MRYNTIAVLIFTLLTNVSLSKAQTAPQNGIQILVNQVAYNQKGSKQASCKK
jgi:hypothetical protein